MRKFGESGNLNNDLTEKKQEGHDRTSRVEVFMAEIQSFFDELKVQLRNGRLSFSDEELLKALSIDDNRFVEHEGELWDFKETWPFSYSDEYFTGLVNLVCAFGNNIGGLIVFNVIDDGKLYKKSKIKTNPDRFINAINSQIFNPPKIEVRVFDFHGNPLPIAVIYPRMEYEIPSKVSSKIGGSQNYIWYIRDGHEKVEADSKKIPLLFCRPQVRSDKQNSIILDHSIPNSAATLPKFVKRFEILEKIFEWLHDDRQPRSFLYGRGGSGKTTIAYEVARQLADNNLLFSNNNVNYFDIVIFISAKKVELDVYESKTISFAGTDFTDTSSLYKAIIICSGWYSDDDYNHKNDDELLSLIEDMFDTLSFFIVVDDIDTLTTAGEDGGLEQLLLILARSKRPSKVLYTLRNAPTHALKSSIEVPGLRRDDEISQFVRLCALQFKVPEPKGDELVQIVRISEGRPLGIESVIALRRTVPTYSDAIYGFEKHAGDNAREYVFQREWDALSATNRSRHLLAALALLKEPVSSAELLGILRFDSDSLHQAIGEVFEMFLDTTDSGDETKYTIGRMTEAFVLKRSEELDRFDTIKERVATFKRSFHPRLPLLNKLRSRAERLIYLSNRDHLEKYSEDAWAIVANSELGPKITENPAYKEMAGEIALRMMKPRITEAREFLLDAHQANYRLNLDVILLWHRCENNTGAGSKICEQIYKLVEDGKLYSVSDKIEINLAEAIRRYNLGKEVRFDDPERSIKLLSSAAIMHIHNLYRSDISNHIKSDKIFEYSRNTVFLFLLTAIRNQDIDSIIGFFNDASKLDAAYFDPVTQPLSEYCGEIKNSVRTKERMGRIITATDRLLKRMEKRNTFMYPKNYEDSVAILKSLGNDISILMKSRAV